MKRILIIVAVLVALVIIGLLTWFLFYRSAPVVETPVQPVTFPSGGSTGASVTVATYTIAGEDNTPIQTKAFLKDPNTHPDPVNAGHYSLGYEPSEDAPYLITYIEETQYFNIVLTQEPLGKNRLAAEQYLMQALGVTQDTLCRLAYTVGTPASVNNAYTGMNLGFSFCPGAVVLP